LSAVTSVLNGSFALNESGYRPAGVPYTVNAVVPVYASVSVSGTVLIANQATLLQSSISNSITAFFGGNPFGASVTVSDLIAVVSNVSGNLLSSFGVTLYDSSGTSVNSVTPLAYGRVILTQVNVSITT
jgi:hypothetical protein